jgi:hypothetical protein
VAFKTIMKAAGYVGRRGGWIYAPDGLTTVAQGWSNLASAIVKGKAEDVIRTVLAANPEPEPKPAPASTPTEWLTPREPMVSAALTLARRMEDAAARHRVVRTAMIPTNHIAPLRTISSGEAGGIGRLLCGRIMGGPLESLDLDRVDCLGCLDAYVAALTGHSPDPHRSAEPPAEVRSPLIKP